MRNALWKRLIPAIGLLALSLAFALPASAQAATTASIASARPSAQAADSLQGCVNGALAAIKTASPQTEAGGAYVYAFNNHGDLYWSKTVADYFCDGPATGQNEEVLDADDNSDCLAYNATAKDVYLHPNCTSATYEQWKFVWANGVVGSTFVLESGYKVNGVTLCLQATYGKAATLGSCSFSNPSAVMVLT